MKLGDYITYHAVLHRVWNSTTDLFTWEPLSLHHPDRGVIVGLRTLQTGIVKVKFETDDWTGRTYLSRIWHRKGSIPAVLVAFDMYRNPVYVPPSAIWYCPPDVVSRLMRRRLTAGAA
jgi:hypothetical protein